MTKSKRNRAPSNIAGSTLVAIAAAVLVGCGGGGGGEAPAPAAPQASTAKSVALSTTSDVAAILPADSSTGAGAVLMRNATGQVDTAVFVLPDGTLVRATADGQGRLAEIEVDGARFAFSDHTDTTVTVTYTPAGGGTATVETVDRRNGAVVAAAAVGRRSALGARSTEGRAMALAATTESGEEQADAAIDDFADVWQWTKSFLPEVLKRKAEKLEAAYQKASEAIEKLKVEADRIDHALGNGMSCRELGVAACAKVAYEQGSELLKELQHADPQAQTTAGFDVSADGVKPKRDDWDPLVTGGQIDPTFTQTEVPCDQSVFADMRPECPQYVAPKPPATDPGTPPGEPTDPPPGGGDPIDPPPEEGLAAHDANMETDAGKPLAASLYYSGAEFFVIETQPAHGTVVLTSASEGTYVYTPAAGFVGTDSFTFVVGRQTSAGQQLSTPGVVTVEVKAVAVPQCEKSVRPNANNTGHEYTYKCANSIEEFWGSLAAGGGSAGFHRWESPVTGVNVTPSINNNFFYMQFTDGVPWVFDAQRVVLDASKRITRLETRYLSYKSWTAGGTAPELDESSWVVEELGYDGTTPVSSLKPGVTSYRRTVVQCTPYKATRKVYLVPMSPTPAESSESTDLSGCETDATVKSFAASFMKGGTMSKDYVMGSEAYRMSTEGSN